MDEDTSLTRTRKEDYDGIRSWSLAWVREDRSTEEDVENRNDSIDGTRPRILRRSLAVETNQVNRVEPAKATTMPMIEIDSYLHWLVYLYLLVLIYVHLCFYLSVWNAFVVVNNSHFRTYCHYRDEEPRKSLCLVDQDHGGLWRNNRWTTTNVEWSFANAADSVDSTRNDLECIGRSARGCTSRPVNIWWRGWSRRCLERISGDLQTSRKAMLLLTRIRWLRGRVTTSIGETGWSLECGIIRRRLRNGVRRVSGIMAVDLLHVRSIIRRGP